MLCSQLASWASGIRGDSRKDSLPVSSQGPAQASLREVTPPAFSGPLFLSTSLGMRMSICMPSWAHHHLSVQASGHRASLLTPAWTPLLGKTSFC